MTTPRRLACILIVLFAFLGGCGGDDDTDSSATTVFEPSATTALSGGPTTSTPPTTEVGGVVQGVADGAICAPQGARGMTRDGVAVVCTSTGGELRWRPQ